MDQALLDEAEQAGRPMETLRLWEPARPMVVVGRSSRLGNEVRHDLCRRREIPVLRRCSGGAAIVTGPGCLMYALVLSYQLRPELRAVDQAHHRVLDAIASALRPHVPAVVRRGISDLAIGQRKFSGNSLRCKQRHLLYHGTLLYDFPLELLDRCLAMPARQPDYRGGRAHGAFVANLPLDAASIRAALLSAWDAAEPRASWPQERVRQLVAERYGRPEWNEPLAAGHEAALRERSGS